MMRKFVNAALGCCVAVTGMTISYGQADEEREREKDRKEERRDTERREERREERSVETDRERPGEVRQSEGRAQARRAKLILGSKVSLRGDVAIGTVDDIVFGDDGYIDYIVVLNEGKYVVIPWEAAKFTFEEKAARATINITQERFREAPVFTQAQWPNVYEPTYRQRVYGFYGISPRIERRSFFRR